jgi:hypothetical protein
MRRSKHQLPEVVEVEEVEIEAAEVVEELLKQAEEELEDKIQSNPSRRPKRTSHLYEYDYLMR